jgi:hypothetical protein
MDRLTRHATIPLSGGRIIQSQGNRPSVMLNSERGERGREPSRLGENTFLLDCWVLTPCQLQDGHFSLLVLVPDPAAYRFTSGGKVTLGDLYTEWDAIDKVILPPSLPLLFTHNLKDECGCFFFC